MKGFFAVLAFVGVAMMVLAQLSGIIETLYLWGGNDQPFGASVWEGFKTWMILMGGGLLTFLISFFIADS